MEILESLKRLFTEVVATDDDTTPLPTVLRGIGPTIQRLTSVEFGSSGNGLEQWLSNFQDLIDDRITRETLIIRVIQLKLPRVAEVLAMAGVITLTWDAAADRPRSFEIAWDKLDGFARSPGDQLLNLLISRAASPNDVKRMQVLVLLLLSGPDELVSLEYHKKGFLSLPMGGELSTDDLAELINSPIAITLVSTLLSDPMTVEKLRSLNKNYPNTAPFLEIDAPEAGQPLNGFRARLVAQADAVRKLNLPIPGTDWRLRGDAKGTSQVEGKLTLLRAGNRLSIDRSASARSTAQIRILLGKSKGDADAFLFGNPSGTFFAVGSVEAGLTLHPQTTDAPKEPGFGFVLAFNGVRAGVGTDALKAIGMGLQLPGSLKFNTDFTVPYVQGEGLQLDGNALATEFPHHLGFALGGSGAGLWVDDLLVRLELAVGQQRLDFRVMLRFDARAELGPMRATISGAGAWIGRWPGGNAGLLEPTGVGLSLDAGVIQGGGYIAKLGPGEYGGALSLKILGIGAFAYGIYKQLPGGEVSFVALIGIRLPYPGIQIGFGFAVSGFGGLIGINRRANLDRLRDKLAGGTAGDTLFNDDPTKNAPKLLGELRSLFPDEKGVHVFGPTLQLNWLSFIKLDLGLFIELPGPRKIFVAGSGRVIVGSPDFALVNLRLDFVGGVDLTESLVFFEGYLVNSRILGIIQITGGLAFRLGYGANAYFLFSVGGFHPQFNPGGLPVPKIPRAGAGFDTGIVWFRQQMYYAVTSNTVQFGARTEAGIKISIIKVHGWVEFNALIQLKPFYFEADVDAGMAASAKGVKFASIRVQGKLSGPGPLMLRAKASVRVIVKISKSVTLTLDKSPGEQLPSIDNLAKIIAREVKKPENVRGEGRDPGVVLGPDATGMVPIGAVVWEQKRAPLGVLLKRFDGASIPEQTLHIEVNDAVPDPEHGSFALASFTDLSDSEKLSVPAFSTAQSGFRVELSKDMATGDSEKLVSTLNLIRLPDRRKLRGVAALVHAGILEGIAERGSGARLKPQEAAVIVNDEQFSPGASIADGYLTARRRGTVSLPYPSPRVSLTGVL